MTASLTYADQERIAYISGDSKLLTLLQLANDEISGATDGLFTQDDLSKAETASYDAGFEAASDIDAAELQEKLSAMTERFKTMREALQSVSDDLNARGALDRKGLAQWSHRFLLAHGMA